MRRGMIATTALALGLTIASGAGAQGAAASTRAAGGADAPGGWAAYRQPTPGYALPVYWHAPRFVVTDWRALGLRQPPAGLRWSRYYDDAVLIDRNGSIHEVAPGIARAGRDDPYYLLDDRVYAGPAERGGMDAQTRLDDRDLAHLDADEPPVAPERAPPPPREQVWHSAPQHDDDWVSPDGRTVVTIRSGPAVTTTTETYEDVVTYSRAPVRKVHRKRAWRPRTKLRCACSS